MRKKSISKKYLKKIIKTTQSIEGYSEVNSEIVKMVSIIRNKYGIKVSSKG
jgi:hypothetical protein